MTLKTKLVHDIWNRQCHLVGREVWQRLARMALTLFFFLGSQEDHSFQSFLKAEKVHVTGSWIESMRENVQPFLQARV